MKTNLPRWRAPIGNRSGFWYLFHNGKRASLAGYGAPLTCTGKFGGRPGSREEQAEAMKARDKFLAAIEQEPEELPLTFSDAGNYYLQNNPKLSADTRKRCEDVLKPFCDEKFKGERHGDMLATSITKEVALAWLASHPAWKSDTTRYNRITLLKAVLNFAKDCGLIETNPLAGMKQPKGKGRGGKEVCLTVAEEGILAGMEDSPILTFWRALLATGARPSELAKATAEKHLYQDAQGAYIRLEWDEWKNGPKQHTARIIRLPVALAASLPQAGYLFTNSRGKRWTSVGSQDAWRVLREKAGLRDSLTLYCGRHSFITRMIAKGVSGELIGKMCGTSASEISRTYDHVKPEDVLIASLVA